MYTTIINAIMMLANTFILSPHNDDNNMTQDKFQINTVFVLPRLKSKLCCCSCFVLYNTIYINVGVSNKIMANVTSHSTINVSKTTDKKYTCWVNGTPNNYTLDTSSIETDGLTPDTVYSIGCVEVDEDGYYQCTEYNKTVMTGENALIYVRTFVCV